APEALPAAVVSRLTCSELRRPYRQGDSHLCPLYPPWSAAQSLPQLSCLPSQPPGLSMSAWVPPLKRFTLPLSHASSFTRLQIATDHPDFKYDPLGFDPPPYVVEFR